MLPFLGMGLGGMKNSVEAINMESMAAGSWCE